MTILETLQSLPHVKVIVSDEHKTICSVKITVERNEQVDSGAMRFSHPRYLTFGQTVVFCDSDITGDQSGALFFKTSDGSEAVAIVDGILDHIHHEKDAPSNSFVINQI